MKTIAIIQARMGSHRLPGKVLLDIAGRPMLQRVVERVSRASRIDQVVVATTVESGDDPVAEFCRTAGINCFRGDHLDVLDRYYRAALQFEAKHVVRVTADCPLIAPDVIDLVVGEYHSRLPEVEYCSNVIVPRTYPRGLDVEVFQFAALTRAWRHAVDQPDREHVTRYFYQHPHDFRLHGVHNAVDESRHRWTVDTPEDLELARKIYSELGEAPFTWQDVLVTAASHPEWQDLNSHIQQKAA